MGEVTAWIRQPVVAGSWYPGEPGTLGETVDAYLEAVRPVDGEPIALVAPHAGYSYSGQVAAHAFKQLEGLDYEVAVIIAADHAPPISRTVSVWAEGGFRTPLGLMPVHTEVARALVEADRRISFDAAAHDGEHPIEIELPFLQRACPHVAIVPVLMGSDDPATVEALSTALVAALRGRKAVVVASSDLSHYPSYEDAVWVDRATLGAIEMAEPEGLRRTIDELMSMGVHNLATCACGEAAILVAMRTAAELGADTYRLLHYQNSGEVPGGDRQRVVGYGALMFWRHQEFELGAGARQELLRLARSAIERHLGGDLSVYRAAQDPALNRRGGAFVTLRMGGELRGCIGYLAQDTTLAEVVQDKAIAAATLDPRFPPLTPSELEAARIDISVLSPLRRVADPLQIQPGVHGVAIYHLGRQGVLLPQVASDRGWGREMFLNQLCLKAGLPEGTWAKGAALYAFTALEFGETEA
jgi:AmmeMemoRadiSam system protein B/AmmeMemoRadiSam system protein A